MNRQFRHKQMPPGNPLANMLVMIVGALVVGVSLVLGVVAFITLAGIVLVLAAVIGIRVWWLSRRLRRQFANGEQAPDTTPPGVEIIEGEYRVVSTRERQDSKPRT